MAVQTSMPRPVVTPPTWKTFSLPTSPGMDVMARALESAAKLLEESPYKKMLADRYASFDSGKGKEFEDGKLTLEDLVAYAKANGEPKQTSGKQELYEAIVNMYC